MGNNDDITHQLRETHFSFDNFEAKVPTAEKIWRNVNGALNALETIKETGQSAFTSPSAREEHPGANERSFCSPEKSMI